jgi:transcriptional regulator with XRE-family HTH domain
MLNKESQFLAENLKAYRTKRGYTQEEFSKLSGLARTTITNIESGEANPALDKLVQIANALNVGVDQLITKQKAQITLYKEEDILKEMRGEHVEILKLFPDAKKGIAIDKVQIQPGEIFRGQSHLSGTKEYLTVLEGKLQIIIEGETFIVERNQVLAFQGDVRHSYKNIGKEKLVYLSVVIPVYID